MLHDHRLDDRVFKVIELFKQIEVFVFSRQPFKQRPHQVQSLVQIEEQQQNLAEALHCIEVDEVLSRVLEEFQMLKDL